MRLKCLIIITIPCADLGFSISFCLGLIGSSSSSSSISTFSALFDFCNLSFKSVSLSCGFCVSDSFSITSTFSFCFFGGSVPSIASVSVTSVMR